jgi:DNA-binding protein H-NS
MTIREKQLELTYKIQDLQKEIAKTRKKEGKLMHMTNEYKIKVYNQREELRKLELELIEVSKTEKADNSSTE